MKYSCFCRRKLPLCVFRQVTQVTSMSGCPPQSRRHRENTSRTRSVRERSTAGFTKPLEKEGGKSSSRRRIADGLSGEPINHSLIREGGETLRPTLAPLTLGAAPPPPRGLPLATAVRQRPEGGVYPPTSSNASYLKKSAALRHQCGRGRWVWPKLAAQAAYVAMLA